MKDSLCLNCNAYVLPYYFIILPTETSLKAGNCSTGAVRVVGNQSLARGILVGRIEVCISNAWGTVCDDQFLNNIAAGVVCQQVGGFFREGKLLCLP